MDLNCFRKSEGFSLIEVIITVAIIGILAAIVIPAYKGYVLASKDNPGKQNMLQLAIAEDNYFYESGTFEAGTFLGGAFTGNLGLVGWTPGNDDGTLKYEVTNCAAGPITQCYTITVTRMADSTVIDTMTRDRASGM